MGSTQKLVTMSRKKVHLAQLQMRQRYDSLGD